VEDSDTMERRVAAVIASLTGKEVEKILSDEAERQVEATIQEMIQENFMQIRRDVQEIVERELPGSYSSGTPAEIEEID
jgi:hemerythrin-like domain-containing protein